MKSINITDIILDFDGTCTQIPIIYEQYLAEYFQLFAAQMAQMMAPITITIEEWREAQGQVSIHSPQVGWMLSSCPSAPAAADPYILAGETANFILRSRNLSNSIINLGDIHHKADSDNLAPWRPEAQSVFEKLLAAGKKLHFVSNSSKKKIQDKLLNEMNNIDIPVEGYASKYNICELTWDSPAPIIDKYKKLFTNLPAEVNPQSLDKLNRPVYLRRGSYFEAIYRALSGDLSKLETTVFCGDIWELDLAMPHALGAKTHLISRAEPFGTYPYELDVVSGYGDNGIISNDLTALLEWI